MQRYLLDTGPAFDFLFRRKGVESRVEEALRSGSQDWDLYASSGGDCCRAGGQRQL